MISPLAFIDPSAKVGHDVTIYPFAFIDADVTIGDGCTIMPYASVMGGTTMGKNNKVYQGAVIGADPQDFRWERSQKSTCTIGDGNTFREQVIINRGFRSAAGTNIGNNCFIMAETHIGHDSVIGDKCVLGNGVKIAGDTEIGSRSILSSNVIINESVKVGRWAFVKGGTRISSNVPPYVILAHNPVRYYGVNAPIMTLKKFTDAEIDVAAKAYRHLYQTQTSVFNALKRIEHDIDPCNIRDEIIEFVRKVNYRIAAAQVNTDLD